ncbi:PEBP-like protein [Tricholoma matsutake]|nr:PEBP-like protein [Tricholoma matsutake 945]
MFDRQIPSDLSLNFDPSVLLEVSLPQTSGDSITLHAGIHLPLNATVGPPSFGIRGEATGPFVIAMVDPDTPAPWTRTAGVQVRHFLGANFVERSTRFSFGWHDLKNTTAAISHFIQPRPAPGSSYHRYTFLLFKQPPGFNNQTVVTPTTSVFTFNVSEFAAATDLGNPIGGTFMLVAPNPPVA